ncbi:WhiB family transcriptional regulator [Streptomyces sp. NPDC054842]
MNVRRGGPTAGGEGWAAVAGEGSRAWESAGSCRHQDADLWFSRATRPAAMAICSTCPVLEACRDAVLRREKGLPRCRRNGVIAGLTGPQRYALDGRAGQPETRQPEPSAPVSAGPSATPDRSRPAATKPPPCGTRAAYQRHLRRREPVDEACRAANSRSAGRYRRTGSTTAPNHASPSHDHGGAEPTGTGVTEPSPAHPHRSM